MAGEHSRSTQVATDHNHPATFLGCPTDGSSWTRWACRGKAREWSAVAPWSHTVHTSLALGLVCLPSVDTFPRASVHLSIHPGVDTGASSMVCPHCPCLTQEPHPAEAPQPCELLVTPPRERQGSLTSPGSQVCPQPWAPSTCLCSYFIP